LDTKASKNKDVNAFQKDVYYLYTLPSVVQQMEKKEKLDCKL